MAEYFTMLTQSDMVNTNHINHGFRGTLIVRYLAKSAIFGTGIVLLANWMRGEQSGSRLGCTRGIAAPLQTESEAFLFDFS